MAREFCDACDRPCPGCAAAHPAPTLAQEIALAIEADLADRAGLGLGGIDRDTRADILDAWATAARVHLTPHAAVAAGVADALSA